jgi:hypothetical protein
MISGCVSNSEAVIQTWTLLLLSLTQFPVPVAHFKHKSTFQHEDKKLAFLLIQSFTIEAKIHCYSFALHHIIVFHESRLMMQLFFFCRKPSICTLTIDFHTCTQVNISTINPSPLQIACTLYSNSQLTSCAGLES